MLLLTLLPLIGGLVLWDIFDSENTTDKEDSTDEIEVSDGNDIIDEMGSSNDLTIMAGDGNDMVTTGGGDDLIHGQNGSDSITSGDGDDTVVGGRGDDDIISGAGNDEVNTGPGRNDVSTGDGNDTVIGGNGNDTVSTGLGDDLVHLGDGYNLWREDDTASYDPRLMSDNDTVEGGFAEPGYHNSDYLISRFGSDSLSGYGGNDNISALDDEYDNTGTSLENAPDTLNGGSGDDRFYADDGDLITAGDGADEIYINVETDPREGDAEPVIITDFNTDEDVLIVTGNTFDASVVRTVAVPESNGYALTAHGIPFAVLENVSADDIWTIDFRVYRF